MSTDNSNRQPAPHQADRDEEHLECMRAFRQAHDAGKTGQAELPITLPNLMKIGYLLNLIRQRGTVLLSPNWQN